MRTVSLILLGVLSAAVAAGVTRSYLGNSTTMEPKTTDTNDAGIRYSKSNHDITRLPREEVERLAELLTAEERQIMLRAGTERAFCGTLLDNKKEGTYVCNLCSLPLFSSDAKFKSGTGWPSFYQPYDFDHIRNVRDESHGMTRIEILCTRCDGHLGHVFEDGPRPTGLRYCLNSAALEFHEKDAELPEAARPVATQEAYFAGGCFWGVEDRFQQVDGVIDAVSGYQGGKIDKPSYKQVCSGNTGHAESVRIRFDPARVTYGELLERFFQFHNPTQLNRQGPDIGTQYRSAIFPVDDDQRAQAVAFIETQSKAEKYRTRPIVTTIEKFATFYEAEEYHQDYHAKHGGSCPIPE